MQTIGLSSIVSSSSLLDYLQELLPISKSKIKALIDNKKRLKKKVSPREELELPLNLVNHGMINPQYMVVDECLLLEEDEHFVALHKPGHCHTHPLTYDDQRNALSCLRKIGRSDLLAVGDGPDRGLLYRLDYETSGLLILAKEQKILMDLRMNFHQAVKKKIYYAVVCGDCSLNGEYTAFLSSHGPKGSLMKVSNDENDGERGSLKITPTIYNPEKDLQLLEIELHQGIRHQIRAQLSHLGFPILGDEKYGGKVADRLFLHAYHYQIEYEGKTFSWNDPHWDLFSNFFDLHRSL